MIKISKFDAYHAFDEIDFKVMDQELNQLFSQRGNSDMTHQFFLDDDGSCIVMEVYYDGERVETYRFQNKGVLTEQGKKAVGRPSLGTTKKVSLTLPDEVWEKIDEDKVEEDISQSALLRSIVEDHYTTTTDLATPEEKERRFAEFKDFVFNTDISKLTFHIYKHGLVVLSPIEKVEPYYDNGIQVTFNGGNFHIWNTNKIAKCSRPSNLLIECETCYRLHNEYEEPIGYLYTKK